MNWEKYHLPEEINQILEACPDLTIASTTAELVTLSCGGLGSTYFEVAYDVPGRGKVVEATVCRVRNGVAANYPEPYMRRRDPDSMVIADNKPTDKPTFKERFGEDFAHLRKETLDWLSQQPLLIFGFISGKEEMGEYSVLIAPANAGFFALSLALLQGIIPYDELPEDFDPGAILYIAPPFRHTHFDGKQVVVHSRGDVLHEMFAYNLYPGPSAKKGVYGALLTQGEREGWVTTHCSAAQIMTPYDNITTIMHEGASGSGKSEMLSQATREADGRLLMGENIVTGERQYLEMPRFCRIHPVVDDMALCHPSLQAHPGKLSLTDAEDAWFIRVDHIEHYGKDIVLERLTAQTPIPLLFLNIDVAPEGRALIWEHIEDAPGKPCPNPRVVVPRGLFPNIVKEPVDIDIRSFGVRTPPCTKNDPSYGIIGLFHLLPPALAWLWRLVAPRGYANPSIVDGEGMHSEGVGSYWPFATGRRVDQANLLLKQFRDNPNMLYILSPNQHVGAWKVGFMPEWIAREYLARRGVAKFKPEQLREARCSLLGYILQSLHVEGRRVSNRLLQVEAQPEIGEEAYDQGAQILRDFFLKCLEDFRDPTLDPLGQQIIACCLDKGRAEDYEKLIPST